MNEILLGITREFTLQADGEPRKCSLRINRLYYDEAKQSWRCDWSLDYLYPEAVHFTGDDPLQALSRTLDFASSFIRGSVTDGAHLYWQWDGDMGGLDFSQCESGNWKLRPEDLRPDGDSEVKGEGR